MNEQSLKTINILFISTHSCGITSLIHRILFNSFSEKIISDKNVYTYKILTSEGFITLNFWDVASKKRFEVINEINFKGENIIIFIYNLEKYDPSSILDVLKEELTEYLKDIIKKAKFGIIGNKFDLIKNKDYKAVKERGEKYAEKLGTKILFTSAKTGKGDPLQYILYLINTKLKTEIIKNKNSILRDYIKTYKNNNLCNVVRCLICNTKIGTLKFHDKVNKIEYNCKNNHKEIFIFTYQHFLDLNQNDKKCKICKKKIQEKNIDSLLFCNVCKTFICIKCIERHEHCSEEEIISPYFLEDQLCEKHRIKNDIYCLDCKSLICGFCHNNYHIKHKIISANNYIDKIIEEKKNLIMKQKKQLELFNNYTLDLIENINKIYNRHMEQKRLELKLKENILKQFGAIKYNNELLKTVTNMRFEEIEKKITINPNSSILEKISTFLEFIEQPVNIIKYNICNNIYNGNETPVKNVDILNVIDFYSHRLTDVCKVYNNNFCISFDDGTIKLYKNTDIVNHSKICKLYEENKGVNSMINYNNENILYVSGYEKIFQITFNEKLMPDIENIIIHPNLNIIKICKYNYNNSIIYSDNLGSIHLYNLLKKTKTTIISETSNSNFLIGNVVDLVNINKNIFYIKYTLFDLNIDISRDTIIENVSEEEKRKEISKLFYIDINDEICNEYLLPEESQIKGVINKDHLLIQEENRININKYKIFNYKTKNEINFENLIVGTKKDWKFKLLGKNDGNGGIYFSLIDTNFTIVEFTFFPKRNIIQKVGIFTKPDFTMYNNKILDIILFKKSLIAMNVKGQSYKIDYY